MSSACKPFVTKLDSIVGKTLASVHGLDGDCVTFSDGVDTWKMFHRQDCCESVRIVEVHGDAADLIGSPIIKAEEVTDARPYEGGASGTWTFYHFRTARGSVTIRWLGESSGPYAVSVRFEKEGA